LADITIAVIGSVPFPKSSEMFQENFRKISGLSLSV
jgi:hypothetical protein